MWLLLIFAGLPLVGSLVFIYVMIFGPSEFHRDGLVGRMHYFLLVTLPSSLDTIGVTLFGQGCVRRVKRAGDYVMNQANPLLQIFYMFLVTGGLSVFLSQATGRVLEGVVTSRLHAVLAPLMIFLTYYFFYVACTSDPGKITPAKVSNALKVYQYDNVLFRKKDCNTCHIQKPARSKHCSLCHACVARYDHRKGSPCFL